MECLTEEKECSQEKSKDCAEDGEEREYDPKELAVGGGGGGQWEGGVEEVDEGEGAQRGAPLPSRAREGVNMNQVNWINELVIH